jgi:drug/metabolite transporter (DMT)-like permease
MNPFYNYLAMFLCIALIPLSHLLIKYDSKKEDSLFSSFMKPKILLGFLLLWIVTLLSVYSFQKIPLKTSAAWTSLTYVLTTLLASVFLKEKIHVKRWFGCFLIVGGILIFQFG